ncbi:uncharacterized protein LOC123904124 [Trifolium pratense]|nr:uncharacterized protein LOC123904124 [Trifolium pratense]
MNGNFRNSYRGGWNGTPFDNFRREQFNYNYQIPHDWRFYYAHDMHLTYQTPAHYYPDMRPLPYQVPAHYAGNSHLTHQRPQHYADKRHLSKQNPKHSADKKPLPQQTPEDFADKTLSLHKKPEDFADKRNLPHQKPEDYTDNKCLPQLCEQSTKLKTSKEHHVIQNCALKRNDQPNSNSMDLHSLAGSNTSALTKDTCSGSDAIGIAPPQGPVTSQINSQTKVKEGKQHHEEVQNGGVKDCAAKKCLPRQMPKPTIPSDKKCLPPQMPKPTIPSDKKCSLRCEFCHVTISPNYFEQHNNGRKHRRNLKSKECKISKGEVSRHIQNSQMNPVFQPKEVPKSMNDGRPVENMSQFRCKEVPAEGCKKLEDHAVAKDQMPKLTIPSDKKCLPHQMPKPTIPSDKKCLPPQMPKPTNPSKKKRKKRAPLCEICHVRVPTKDIELHNNGKKHRRNLKSKECKISKGKVSGLAQNSQMNAVVQPKEVPKSMKVGRPVENMSQFRCKEVPAEGSKRKLGDQTVAKDHGFKVKKLKNESPSFMNKKVPAEKRKVSDNTDAKDHDSNPEIGETSGAKYMKMNSGIRRPVESLKSESPHVSASLSKESKGKEHQKFQKTVEKNDQPQSTPVELNASEGSNRKESTSCDFAAIPLPQVPMNCPVFTPSPAVESSIEPSIQTDSQVEVEEGKEHHGVQNCGVETNDQPQSITMELHANGGSDINTLIKEDTCSDSGAIVIIPSQSPIASQVATPVAAVESSYEPESPQVKQTEMSDDKVHNEIQDHTVDSNDQQQSISMELDDPAGCMTNTQTEVVNSDSAVTGIVIDPLAYALPDAVWSGFEPLTDTEIEPQVSEAVVYNESHQPIDEIDIELPPSVSMEIDAASEVKRLIYKYI